MFALALSALQECGRADIGAYMWYIKADIAAVIATNIDAGIAAGVSYRIGARI